MKLNLRKSIAAAIAAVLAVGAVPMSALVSSAEDSETIYEFEDGTLSGATAMTADRDGNAIDYSGSGLVFLQDSGETATVTVTVPETDMYTLTLATYTPYGNKTHNLLINDVDQGQISFEENTTGFVETELGKFKLTAGENTITVKSSWGWTYLDYIKISGATFPELNVTNTLCDSNATSQTQSLMNYLTDVYGEHIISGQQEIYKYGPHDFEYEFEYIYDTTGKYPALRGFDFLNTNPLYGSEDGTVDRMIDWVNTRGGIAEASWHLNVPNDMSSYTVGEAVSWNYSSYDATTNDFDPENAYTEGTKEYEYYKLALSQLAEQIQKLQDAGVSFIFRPLHEAEGGGGETGSWFWWGKKGSAVYKQLWIYTYKTLTEEYNLHNIIWEWNSYAYSTSTNWYPGDEYVDIVAYDKYNCTDWSTGSAVYVHNDSAISGTFYNLVDMYDGKKLVAMAENDSIPTLENILAEKAGWLYFMPWYDGGSDNINFLSNELFNTKEDLITMYQSDYCITLDELPENLYTSYEASEDTTKDPSQTTVTTTKKTTTTTTTTTTTKVLDENQVAASISKSTLTFPSAIGDAIYLDLTLGSDIAYANGCVGISVTVDDQDYWVSFKWETKKSGETVASLDSAFNVTYNEGTETIEVEDESVIAAAVEAAKAAKTAEFQVWWTNDKAGEAASTSEVTLNSAYVLKSDEETSEEVSEPETVEESTEVTEEETTAPTEESKEEETTAVTETEAVSETVTEPETEATTVVTEEIPDGSKYGDVNVDGVIDVSDVVLLNKSIVNAATLSESGRANADALRNNIIDSNDALTILRYLVMSIDSLPVKE
jgi:hypothetical protein